LLVHRRALVKVEIVREPRAAAADHAQAQAVALLDVLGGADLLDLVGGARGQVDRVWDHGPRRCLGLAGLADARRDGGHRFFPHGGKPDLSYVSVYTSPSPSATPTGAGQAKAAGEGGGLAFGLQPLLFRSRVEHDAAAHRKQELALFPHRRADAQGELAAAL